MIDVVFFRKYFIKSIFYVVYYVKNIILIRLQVRFYYYISIRKSNLKWLRSYDGNEIKKSIRMSLELEMVFYYGCWNT
jgi:hypothetical protein